MADGHSEQPIIIKKKKGGHGHGHHGGAWKVAYADFVTAMMAFFLVMWIMGLSESHKRGIASYFQNPGLFQHRTGKAKPIDVNQMAVAQDAVKEREQTENYSEKGGDFAFINVPDSLTREEIKVMYDKAVHDSIRAERKVEEFEKEVEEKVQTMMKERPDLEKLLKSIKFELTNDGLRIDLVESDNMVFFEVGSANLTAKAKEILQTLAVEIGKLPNSLEIEGHTDSRGYSSGRGGYTNWELSSDRANAARKFLETNGLWDGQVQGVIGFADRKLRVKENPFDITNRRVTIMIGHMTVENFLSGSNTQ